MNSHQEQPPNRLIHEKSPYLLQHAHNPVDWHPWGDDAFERARREEKLVFLSIGYSTCHWCHVMAHESFEDGEVAAALARDYVAVKVDREERPDIDQVYMEICQRLTGRGGWPLTVVLCPDGLPVFAATYLPKNPRPGYDGLVALLERIASQARENAAQLRSAGEQLVTSLSLDPAPTDTTTPHARLLTGVVSELRRSFDPGSGGFGRAPKFPTPHHIRFLLQQWHLEKSPELVQMAEETLIAMSRGGIHDHLGGGFHRYSTDQHWLVPHFEKMLYDQAGLAEAFLDAYLATGRQSFAGVVRDILDYVCQEMSDPAGGFHAAEDADSEGEEGIFYVWSRAEVEERLGTQLAPLFCEIYGIREGGNFNDEASGRPTGLNILHRREALTDSAARHKLEPGVLRGRLDEGRRLLLEARGKRPPPHRDDKILCAWNGLMIGALARAGKLLKRSDYADAAERAARFVLGHMRREDGRLLRRWRDSEAAIPAFAEDYAFLARGLLELYPLHFETAWLEHARELAADLQRLFAPENGGALFDTAADSEALVTRPRTLYDGATLSANSAAMEVFANLYHITGDISWREHADGIYRQLAPLVAGAPTAFTGLLHAATLLYMERRELVVVGEPGADDTRAMLEVAEASKRAIPNLTLLLKAPSSRDLVHLAPYTAKMECIEGRATAYLCSGQSCRQPTTDARELERQLRE